MAEYMHQGHGRILRDVHNTRTCSWFVYDDENVKIQPGYIRKDSGGFLSWAPEITVDSTVTGIDGSKDGSLSADTNYFLFILDDSGTAHGFITDEFYIGTLPGAATEAVLIGYLRTDASGDLERYGSIDHNTTSNKQGGVEGEYYHQTEDQWSESTGWLGTSVQSDITLSFDDGTRTLTVTPASTAYYYIQGVQYSFSSPKTVTIDNTEGVWYIYFVGDTLTASQVEWDIAAGDKAYVAYLYWDATNTTARGFIGWECHGKEMSTATHDELHHTIHTQFESGHSISDNGDGTVDMSTGIIHDENIKIETVDGAGSSLFEQVLSPLEAPVVYSSGAGADARGAYNGVSNTYICLQDGSEHIGWNEYTGGAWQISYTSNNEYAAMWVIATNCLSCPIILVMGQGEPSNLLSTTIDNNSVASINWAGIPFEEFRVLYRVILRDSGSPYTITQIDDFRVNELSVGTGIATSHAALSDLTTSGHPASVIIPDTTSFGGELSSADDTVQKALDTLDDAFASYLPLAGGTMAGDIAMGTNSITGLADPSNNQDAATKAYVDSVANGLDWQDSVIDKDLTAPPGGESTGDRYIVGTGATGDWAGHDGDIAEYNGAGWDFTSADEGMAVWVEDENKLYVYNGSAWVTFGSTMAHDALQGLLDDDHTQYLLADGTRTLSSDWDAGSHKITAETLESDVATGTAPLTIASTTLVSNLNADLLDGNEASAFSLDGHTHVHNDTTDKQGGDTDQYYHLSLADYNALTDANAQLTALHTDGSPTFADITLDSIYIAQRFAVTDLLGSAGGGYSNAVKIKTRIPFAASTGMQTIRVTFNSYNGTAQYDIFFYIYSGAFYSAKLAYHGYDDPEQVILSTDDYDGTDYVSLVFPTTVWAHYGNVVAEVRGSYSNVSQSQIIGWTCVDEAKNASPVDEETLTAHNEFNAVKASTYESTIATGTAPLTIASTTLVSNLNADLLDGNEASAFSLDGHTHVHNDTTDKQGGDTDEYYHLSLADYNALTDANAQLAALHTDGSPTFADITLNGGVTSIYSSRYYTNSANIINATPDSGTMALVLTGVDATEYLILEITGYGYIGANQGLFKYIVGGLWVEGSSDWVYVSAMAIGNVPSPSVRLGYNGDGDPCVFIGTTATVWEGSGIVFANISLLSSAGQTTVDYSFLDDETGYTVTDTPVTNYKSYYRDDAIHIASLDDGHLDLTADTSVDVNSDLIVTGDVTGQDGTFAGGSLGVGVNTGGSEQRGELNLYGDSTGGTYGGLIRQYLSADYDAAFEYFVNYVRHDDWYFSAGSTDLMKFQDTTKLSLYVDLDLDGDLDASTQATSIAIKDDEAAALDITEGANSYLKFVTTNGSEAVEFGQNLDVNTKNINDVNELNFYGASPSAQIYYESMGGYMDCVSGGASYWNFDAIRVPTPTDDKDAAPKDYVDGNFIKNDGVYARAYLGTAQEISNAVEQLDFDNESYDEGSDFNTTTYDFVAPEAGKYLVTLNVTFMPTNTGLFTGDQCEFGISVNDTYTSISRWLAPADTGTNNYYTVSVSDIVDCSASDTIQAYAKAYDNDIVVAADEQETYIAIMKI